MPALVRNEIHVQLSKPERNMYDTMCSQLVLSLDGKEIDAVNAAALSNKLCQMANGAVYDEENESFPFMTENSMPWRTFLKVPMANPY